MNDREKQQLRSDRGALEQALKEAGVQSFRGKICLCPFHKERTPSGGIYEKDGVWRFKCHGCKVNEDVIGVLARAAGKKSGEVMAGTGSDRREPAKVPPRVYADANALRAAFDADRVHVYTNPETGKGDMAVARIMRADGKTFLQFQPAAAAGGFVLGAPPKPWPIYNRTRIRSADEVWIVEGEKCVEIMAQGGATATTSPGGAGKAKYADWSPVAGKKVYLWPDNDAAGADGKSKGVEHMRDVVEILKRLDPPPSMFWIEPSELELPAKGDAADYLAPCNGDREAMANSLDAVQGIATPCGGCMELDQLIEDTIAGKRKAIRFPWQHVSRVTRALMPGTVTCFCGEPSSGKSLLLLYAACWWHQAKVKVAIYELEDDLGYHLSRCMAQLEGFSEVLDPDWVVQNPDETRKIREYHRATLDSFSRCIFTSPDDDEVPLKDLLDWIEDRCKSGCRIVIIDPVTAAATGEKNWIEDRLFIMRAKAIVRKYGASLILATHPKMNTKSGTAAALHSMAGGAAYPRFSHTVLWLVHHDKSKKVQVQDCGQILPATINRSLRIAKARNGSGSKLELGYHLDGKTLRFTESGIVVKEVKNEEKPEQEASSECPI